MKKKRLKENLMKEYVYILNANHFSSFCLIHMKLSEEEKEEVLKIYTYTQDLLQTYKKIMFKIGLIDLSLAILDKEVLLNFSKEKNENLEKEMAMKKLKDTLDNLKEIGKNLPLKILGLKFNDFELNYLNLDNLAKFTAIK